MTPAAISKVVDSAALEVFRQATQTGDDVKLDTEHLLRAIEHLGGRDRPTVEHWTWDSIVLPPAVKSQLRQLQARDRGPRGGAAVRRRAADRAVAGRPARDRQDDHRQGARRSGSVLVLSGLGCRCHEQVGRRVGAARPALLRGGRLSRTILLGLPDEAGRLAILRLYSGRMPTVNVRPEELARETEGLSPADLKALCQEAGMAAMARSSEYGGAGAGDGRDGDRAVAGVTHEDFLEALRRLREGSTAAGAGV